MIIFEQGSNLWTTPKDLQSKEIGQLLIKYLHADCETPTEERFQLIRFIENLTEGTGSIVYTTESMHGAGSPEAHRIIISRQGEFEKKQQLIKDICLKIRCDF